MTHFSEELDFLWTLADKFQCDGDCEGGPTHTECSECRAARAINDVGDVILEALHDIKQEEQNAKT